jgi:hypothetical protein
MHSATRVTRILVGNLMRTRLVQTEKEVKL